jgi:hypothetical protein
VLQILFSFYLPIDISSQLIIHYKQICIENGLKIISRQKKPLMEQDKLLIQFEENSRHLNAFGRT